MPLPLFWPPTLRKQQIMFHPMVPSRSGGMSVSGVEQVIASSAGFWRADIIFHVRRTSNTARPGSQHLAWRAMLANLEGRSNPFCIGPCDHANAPAALAGVDDLGPYHITHSDDAPFSDGSYYAQYATSAHMLANAALGVTAITIWIEAGHAPEAGQYFGIGQRLYLIKSAVQSDTNEWTLRFWPTLRKPAVVGETINFDNPVCTMRFATDEVAELAIQVGRGIVSNPTLRLLEYPEL